MAVRRAKPQAATQRTSGVRPRRLSRTERIKLIESVAANLFAERGLAVSTHEIAARLSVTQALIYRFFASKDALIDAVLDRHLSHDWPCQFVEGQAVSPLSGEQLLHFYRALAAPPNESGARLYLACRRADRSVPDGYERTLHERYLLPLIKQLRAATGLPEIQMRPLMPEELALVQGLHDLLLDAALAGAVSPAREERAGKAPLLRLLVNGLIAAAPQEVRRLHDQA